MTNPPHDPGAAPGFSPSPQAALEFLQKMWNPLGVPIPGFGLPAAAPGATAATPPGPGFPHPAMMFAALDPAEVQRKIDELRVIENWLAMSLSMMQMSVKTLELQKASLEALRGTVRQAAAPPQAERKRAGPAK